MHKQEYGLENETHWISWNFDIKTEYTIMPEDK